MSAEKNIMKKVIMTMIASMALLAILALPAKSEVPDVERPDATVAFLVAGDSIVRSGGGPYRTVPRSMCLRPPSAELSSSVKRTQISVSTPTSLYCATYGSRR